MCAKILLKNFFMQLSKFSNFNEPKQFCNWSAKGLQIFGHPNWRYLRFKKFLSSNFLRIETKIFYFRINSLCKTVIKKSTKSFLLQTKCRPVHWTKKILIYEVSYQFKKKYASLRNLQYFWCTLHIFIVTSFLSILCLKLCR